MMCAGRSVLRHAIDDLDDPRLDPYRHLKTTNITRGSSRFIAEGKLVVQRLLESGWEVESVLVSDRRELWAAPRVPDEVPLLVLPQKLAERLVGYNFHVGVLACGIRRPAPSISEIASKDGRQLLIACEAVSDPENVGAIIRLCAAFGASGVVLGLGCSDPFSRRVLRVSMGTAFRVPIVESADLAADIRCLRQEFGFETFATVLDPEAESIVSVSPPPRSLLVFGNERQGLQPEVRLTCGRQITIPMQPGADSLNVAVSAALFLYHFQLQGQ